MLSFDEYLETLLEARAKKPPKEKKFNLNDAKGKLFEILAGSHFEHGTHKSGRPNNLLTHYRDEEGKSPKDVHDYIKGELDTKHPDMYDEINRHASEAAEHLRDQLAAHGHTNVKKTAWTSQPGDHEKFTGIDDPNSDADLMVKGNNGPVGLSLKYGKNKDMNLRNNGLDELENMAALEKGSLTGVRKAHQKELELLGLQDHEQYKAYRDSADPDEKNIANLAEKSAIESQREMARKMSEGLSKRSSAADGHKFLKQYVKDRISPKTQYQHFRLHSRPNDKGDVTHHFSDMQDDSAKLDDFEHFRVIPHTGGISIKIEGKRKGSESYEPVLDQAIKKGSGPMKGFASTTKAPFLTKKDKGKALVSPNKVKATKSKMKTAPVMAAPVAREPTPQEDAMTNEGGREPNKRDSGGVHGGRIFNDKV
jgi:hypothetical protein